VQKVRLKETSISVSRFVFGTASLFNSGSAEARRKLLCSAIDAGFTHFDTAPYYGFGTAELDLGPVLKKNPEVTVTTKVGIYSPGGESQRASAVFFRKAVGRLVRSLSRPMVDFSIGRAKHALEGSLRRLNRERIDIYTLHEPELHLLNSDEWQMWLDKAVAEGKIGTFGLALTADKVVPFLKDYSKLSCFIQVHDSLNKREADVLAQFGRPLQITYGYVSAARNEGSPLTVTEVLRGALCRNPEGAIIVSTKRLNRLQQYARVSEAALND
jgi:D-threo-aldose 1-dehydrogenase